MRATTDVLIVGGGVIGLSIAYYLARTGMKASVVERSEFGQEASWAGAGLLPGNNPQRAKTPMGCLRGLAMQEFPNLSNELRELTGVDNGYRRCGGLELRLGQDEWEARRLRALQAAEIEEGQTCRVLNHAELHAMEPELADDLPGALYFADAAQVRNPWHLRALVLACRRLGVTLAPNSPVLEMKRAGDRITKVCCPRCEWQLAQVVVAAGAWSDVPLAPLGLKLGVKPIRGQIVLLRLDRPALNTIVMADSRYIVPREDGRTLVGSTEEEVGFVKQTTAQAVRELIGFAIRLVPVLRAAEVERTWAGLRPCSPDRRPVLGPAPGYTNLFVATGHFRSGLQLSPITGILMAQLLMKQPLTLDLTPFSADRLLHVRQH
jgi:glycine oxidase